MNFQCASGEGLALVARRRPGAHVVGFHGTYGSFGMSGASILMPGGLTVEYPNGRSLDVNGLIHVDSVSKAEWRPTSACLSRSIRRGRSSKKDEKWFSKLRSKLLK